MRGSVFTFHIASARAIAHVLHAASVRLTRQYPYMSCMVSKLLKINMVIAFEGRILLSCEAGSTPTALVYVYIGLEYYTFAARMTWSVIKMQVA